MDTAPTSDGLTETLAAAVKAGAATLAGAHSVVEAPRAPSIALRGSGSHSLAKSRFPGRVNGRIRFPETRRAGSASYLTQLVRTCVPLALGDLAALMLSVLAASAVGFDWIMGSDQPWLLSARWLLPTAIGMLMINGALGLYPGVRLGLVEEIKRLSLSCGVLVVITLSRMSLASEAFATRAWFIAASFGFALFFLPFMRSRLRRVLSKTRWWGFPTLVCGNDSAVISVYQWLLDNRRLGLNPLGIITNPDGLEIDRDANGYIGSWEEARTIAEKRHAYWAVLVEPADNAQETAVMAEQHLGIVPHVFVVSELTGMPDHWNRHQMDEGLDGLMVEQHLLLPVQQLVKRLMDLAIATITLLLLAPLFIALAISTKLTSKGPVFYGHTRVGKGNTRFKAWKFRTMVQGADKLIDDYLAKHPEYRAEWERDHKLKNDPRVTALGKWMRKWSIDELPQVWNVICGEMSIVGPRPIVDAEIIKYGEHFETFCTVPPGITGLWQVCGRNDTTYEERVQLDMYYIHHWSPWLDLYLLARTIKTVLFTKGAY